MLRPLTISARDLALLGAGGGDSSTMKALLAGQFSRRVLLVIAVLDSARRKAPGAVRALEASYALLSDVQRTHPRLVEEIITLPCVGNWAAACLRDEAAEETYRYLACLAASAAFRAGREFRIAVPVADNAVCLPTLGTLAVRSPDTQAAVVTGGHAGLTIAPVAGPPALLPDVRAATTEWRPARLLQTSADSRDLRVWLDDSGAFRAPPGPQLKPALTAKEAARWQRILDQAWRALVRRHPARADGMSVGLRALTPLQERNQPGSDSATATDAAGGVLLTPPRHAEDLVLTLLHEFQHTKLAAVEHIVALHKDDRRERYHVRWRDDPRPLGAVLHGAYAHLGVAGYWDSALRLGGPYPPDVARTELDHWCDAVEDAIALIKESAQLTAAGGHFIAGMTATLDQFRAISTIPAH